MAATGARILRFLAGIAAGVPAPPPGGIANVLQAGWAPGRPLFREAGNAADARRALADRLRRGEDIPGSGHPLYPDGDPRGAALLDIAAEAAPGSPPSNAPWPWPRPAAS